MRTLLTRLGLSLLLSMFLAMSIDGARVREAEAAVDPDLLIITPAEYFTALEPLIEHKNATGMSSAMVNLEGIYTQYTGDDEPEKIKNAIKYYYDSYDIKYVMLVGDCNKFPVRWQLGHFNDGLIWDEDPDNDDILYTAADFYYADIYDETHTFNDWDADGDGYYGEIYRDNLNSDEIDPVPEVAVGRVPAENQDQLERYVAKVIAYETSSFNAGWFKNLLLIQAGENWSSDIDAKENIDASLSPLGFSTTRLYSGVDPADYSGPIDGIPTSVTIQQALNNGAGFVSELYHGSPTSWGFYSVVNASSLTNAPALPVIYSGACETAKIYGKSLPYRTYLAANGSVQEGIDPGTGGDFVYPIPDPIQVDGNEFSLGEAFLLASENGAIAYYGCLETGETGMHKVLDENFFKAYSVGKHILGEMWEYAIGEFTGTYNLKTITADNTWGPVCKLHTPSRFLLLGDPSLRVGGIDTDSMPPGTYWTSEFSANAFGRDIVITDDGYAVCGFAQATEGFDYWTLLAEYDLDGNLLQSGSYDDPVRNRAHSMYYDLASDNITVTGYKYHEEGAYGDEWVWLMSTNGTLARQWEEVYGEPFPDWGNSIAWDGSAYIVGGWHGRDMDGNGDGYLLRINPDSTVDWEQTVDVGDNTTWWLGAEIFSVEMTSDGGLILGTAGGVKKISSGGPPTHEWTSGNGTYYSARQTTDGGYIGVGSVEIDGPGGNNPHDMVLTKFNAAGTVEWSVTYGRAGSPMVSATGMMDRGYDVIETGDGYVVAGYTESYGYHGGFDLLVAQYTENGTMDWDIALGGGGFDEGRAIVEAPDGGFVVTGTHYDGGANRIWTVKIPGGYTKPVAYFTYSPPSPLFIENTVSFNAASSYDPDGYLVSYKWDFGDGTTGSGVSPTHKYLTPGTYNATLFVLDNEGLAGEYTLPITAKAMEIQWRNRFGDGRDYGFDITDTPDGGYVIAGIHYASQTTKENLWAFKTDGFGNRSWERIYGSYYQDAARAVTRAHDSGYIVAGYTGVTATDRKIWIMKLDDTDGSKVWEKVYDYGNGFDEAYDIRQDGTGYIVTGQASIDDTGHYDTLLLKIDGNGDYVWHEVYPDPGGESTLGYSVTPTADGGYAVTGGYMTNNYKGPYLTIKIGSDRSETWRTDTGSSGDMSSGAWIYDSPDPGYITAGTLDGDFALVKYTSDGVVDWTETFGWETDYDILHAATVTLDGGYALTGGILKYDDVDESWNDDFYMVRTDSNGETLWDWHILTIDPPDEAGHGVLAFSDGSFVVMYTEYPGTTGSTVLVKIGPNTVPVADFGYSPSTPFSGSPVHFDASNSSDPDGSVWNYYWDFGNGDTDTGETVDYTFPDHGSFDVKLTVVDNDGGVDSITESVSVAEGLSVDFYVDTEWGPVPLTCNFGADASGGTPPYTYEWDMDNDGTPDSTEAAPSWLFDEPGVYTVSLTVTDSLSATANETKADYISASGIAADDPSVTITTGDVTDFPATDPIYTDGAPDGIDWGSAKGFNLAASGPDGIYTFTITFSMPVTPGFVLYKLPGWTSVPYVIIDSRTIEVTLEIIGGVLDPPFVLASAPYADVNSDGNVDVQDLTKIARIILLIDPYLSAADVNYDGHVNVLDITKIARIILGLD